MTDPQPCPIALVTGGAHGIGRAIATRLAADGWGVVIADTDQDRGGEVARILAEDGCRAASFIAADVAREDDVRHAVRRAGGLGPLKAIISNAGIMVRKPVTELSLDDWRRVIDVNLTAAFLLAKHGAPLLGAAGGSMVLIASTRALMSEPDTEAYGASKGGLVALGHALAVSLGPDVRVNTVSPGWIDVSDPPEALSAEDHAQHPAGRVGRPEDVAALVAHLVGPDGAFMTGANLVIDGGMTRKMIYAE